MRFLYVPRHALEAGFPMFGHRFVEGPLLANVMYLVQQGFELVEHEAHLIEA